MDYMYDTVIRGGKIINGTGGDPFVADIAVKDGRIVAVGNLTGAAAEEIDAAGSLVTPGFVDVHTHYDGQVTWENRMAPSSNHGVTTVIMGNCGVGFAPVKPDQHQMVVKLMEGVEDIPDVVMTAGVPWNWETFPDYLDALDQRQADVDFGAQLPHSPLRVYVMGERGSNLEPPTTADLEAMQRLTTEAILAGALGVTSSRSLSHRLRDGTPAPSVPTEVSELLALARGLADAGTGVFQLIPNVFTSAADEFKVLEALVEASGRPLSFSMIYMPGHEENWDVLVQCLREANAKGLPILAQYLPRPVGVLFGLDLSYHPFSLNPSYREIADLPLAEKVARMADPDLRTRLMAEEPDDPSPFFKMIVKLTDNLFPLGDPPNYNPPPEASIGAQAKAMGVPERELIYDELLKNEGRAILYSTASSVIQDYMDRVVELSKLPNAVVGLGDGGAHYGMICDAAYTTYVLARHRASGDGLARTIKSLTSETAAAVGLYDRGVLDVGYKADINVIDLERVELFAPRIAHDLPGGGKRLSQKSNGYVLTMVNGIVTYRGGEPTGALPGRLIRGAQKAPAAPALVLSQFF
jgi:N-acyl-D-amino-acid deacylase